MITALVRTNGRIDELALTLEALVQGVAEGLVADAVLLATQSDEAVETIAEAVGAKLAIADSRDEIWARGAELARREWLLCLEEGDVPGDGWVGAIARFIALAPAERKLARLVRESGVRDRSTALFDLALGVCSLRAGDLVHRSAVAERGLAMRLRPVRLPTRIERGASFRA